MKRPKTMWLLVSVAAGVAWWLVRTTRSCTCPACGEDIAAGAHDCEAEPAQASPVAAGGPSTPVVGVDT